MGILFTKMFPGVLLSIPYYVIMRKLNLIDTHTGLIILNCSFVLPFAVWNMCTFFVQIPWEIEEAALKKETDKLSQEHLAEIQRELSDMRDDFNAKKAQWDNEKGAIGKVQKLREELEAGRFDYVTFTSASTVKGFVSAIGEDADFSRFTGLCIGKQTAGEAEKHHISVKTAGKATIDALVELALEK